MSPEREAQFREMVDDIIRDGVEVIVTEVVNASDQRSNAAQELAETEPRHKYERRLRDSALASLTRQQGGTDKHFGAFSTVAEELVQSKTAIPTLAALLTVMSANPESEEEALELANEIT